MRICIFGAGAVGGQLGARFMRAGIPVSLIARGAHLAAMQSKGLTFVEGANEWVCRPFCTEDPAAIGRQDVVVVTVKTTALAAAARQIPALLDDHTQVVFAINGMPWWFLDGLQCEVPADFHDELDPGGALRNVVGLHRTIGCSINSGGEVVALGIVRSDTPERNQITLGKPDGSEPAMLSEFAALCSRAGYPTAVTPRIRNEMWPKLMTHSCRPPICGLTNMTTRELASDPDLLAVVEKMLKEFIAVGERLGLSFAFDLAKELARKPHGDHVSSLVQDLQDGRYPEVGSGIVAMRRAARAAGVETPVLDAVSALISARVAPLRAGNVTDVAKPGAG
jgi:2-dehydropantoate 2-reductase